MPKTIKIDEAAEMVRHAVEFDRKLITEWLKTRLTPSETYLLKSGGYKKELVEQGQCEHLMSVTVFYRLTSAATRDEPAEYAKKACCDECGEWMEAEDIPDGVTRNEDHGDRYRKFPHA